MNFKKTAAPLALIFAFAGTAEAAPDTQNEAQTDIPQACEDIVTIGDFHDCQESLTGDAMQILFKTQAALSKMSKAEAEKIQKKAQATLQNGQQKLSAQDLLTLKKLKNAPPSTPLDHTSRTALQNVMNQMADAFNKAGAFFEDNKLKDLGDRYDDYGDTLKAVSKSLTPTP